MAKVVTVMEGEWLPCEKVMKELNKSERSVQRLAGAGHLRWKFDTASRKRLYHAGDLMRIKEEGIRTQRDDPQATTTLAPRATAPLSLAPELMEICGSWSLDRRCRRQTTRRQRHVSP